MILSIGEILIDAYKSNDGCTTHIGGAPFNVAVWAKRAGGKVGFVGKVGDDDYGKFIIDKATDYHIDHINIGVAHGLKTTVAEVTLDGNGERSFKFQRDNTADFQLDVNDVDFESTCPNIVHLGTLMLNQKIGRKFFDDALKIAKEKGFYISIDANFRDDLFESNELRNKVLKPYLKSADFLKMGADELLDYTGKTTLEDGAKAMNFKNLLFVTDGGNGSHIFTKRTHIFVPSQRVDVVDSTGAGDAFWGNVLQGIDTLLSCGLPLDSHNLTSIVQRANIVGAQAVGQLGAI